MFPLTGQGTRLRLNKAPVLIDLGKMKLCIRFLVSSTITNAMVVGVHSVCLSRLRLLSFQMRLTHDVMSAFQSPISVYDPEVYLLHHLAIVEHQTYYTWQLPYPFPHDSAFFHEDALIPLFGCPPLRSAAHALVPFAGCPPLESAVFSLGLPREEALVPLSVCPSLESAAWVVALQVSF